MFFPHQGVDGFFGFWGGLKLTTIPKNGFKSNILFLESAKTNGSSFKYKSKKNHYPVLLASALPAGLQEVESSPGGDGGEAGAEGEGGGEGEGGCQGQGAAGQVS